MKKMIVAILAIIGALALLAVLAVVGFWMIAALSRPGVPAKTVLELNLETPLVETMPSDPFGAALMRDRMTVRDVVEALEKAGEDSRVAGLVARFGGTAQGMAQAQEVRDAIRRFREKNKFALAFSETFGEVSPGSGSYYLATSCDEIYLQPSGDIGLTGVIAETPFLRGTLDKLGVKPQMDQRYEYKNAMNTFTEKGFTPAHEEATSRLITSWYEQMLQGISEGRKMSQDEVRALIDRGPFLGPEAVAAKLVDKLAYRDEVFAEAKKRAGERAQFLYLNKYLERAGRPYESGQKIALIYGVGAVVRGKSGYDALSGDVSMGSDTVAGAFRAAIEDRDVKAILFRVDSPGGSYVASDAIWRETVRAKQAGKPVIVSMGDVAGSGGYFVAMSADKIVAQPGTITGSIGVLGGKLVPEGLWEKIGLSWDEVHRGEHATFWSPNREYNEEEWTKFQAWLDRVYSDFTSKVAEGRKMDKAKVLGIAKGRIWTGADAKNIGLVDELGGFRVALDLAKKAAGIAEGEKVRLQVYPRSRGIWQLFDSPESSERQGAEAAMMRTIEAVQPIVRRLRMIAPGVRRDVLSMPPLELSH